MKQLTMRLRATVSRKSVTAEAHLAALAQADFGPDEFSYNYPLPIQHRPEGGFAYRYGLPANQATVGRLMNP